MLQESGHDTVDANVELGLPIDRRDYRVSAAILHRLDIDRIRLITNNPGKESPRRVWRCDASRAHCRDRGQPQLPEDQT
jgi:3,4-dihydroxy 2-butanone 4-phosphate synthase / GTP cyclohydrolase II